MDEFYNRSSRLVRLVQSLGLIDMRTAISAVQNVSKVKAFEEVAKSVIEPSTPANPVNLMDEIALRSKTSERLQRAFEVNGNPDSRVDLVRHSIGIINEVSAPRSDV